MVESATMPDGTVRFSSAFISDFVTAAFVSSGLLHDHAAIYADVLVTADILGIRSHGIARLPKLLGLVERGRINKSPKMAFNAVSDTTGIFDADNGPAPVASSHAMDEALAMAERHGTGFVAVKNSSHLGFPGYYARKAMEKGYIGICMSNGERVVAPTFALEGFLGTNPMSVAIPAGPGRAAFYLDMATAAVARGKVETTLREGRPIPKGWVPESFGPLRLDEKGVLTYDIPLLPLGGEGTEGGGHKGYALSMMVELLCSILTGQRNPFAGHFMGAIKIACFRDPSLVYGHMAEIFDQIRNLKKAPGRDRIYIPGEIEAELESENRRLGIPVGPAVQAQMKRINSELRLGFAFRPVS
jgi:L-2-hydroxycarboxylate dehydrogenase (NAD+)